MADIVDKETGSINMAALSEYNGKTELENTKMIVLFLAQKAVAYGIPQTIRFTYKGDEVEGEGGLDNGEGDN